MDSQQAMKEMPGNVVDRLNRLEAAVRLLSAKGSKSPSQLSELAQDLGPQGAGWQVYGNGGQPGDSDFTGVAYMYPPWVDADGNEWIFVRMANGVIQFGVGSIGVYIAQGQLSIDSTGLSQEGLAWAILLHAINAGYERFGRIGFFLPDGSEIPALGINYEGAAGASLMENGDFEHGDLSHWTASGGGTAGVISPGYSGDYCAEIVGSSSKTITSDRIAVSELTTYAARALIKMLADSSGWGVIKLKWYDDPSAGSLLRTDSILISCSNSQWTIKANSFHSPTGAESVAILFTSLGATSASSLYVDDVTFGEQALSRTLRIDPDLKYNKDGVDVLTLTEDMNLKTGDYQIGGSPILERGSSIYDGIDHNRASGGTYSSYASDIEMLVPVLITSVKVDCYGGANYTLKVYDRYGGTELVNLGTITVPADPGASAVQTFTPTKPFVLYPGIYRFHMTTSAARNVWDYNGVVPRQFTFTRALVSYYGGGASTSYTQAIKLVGICLQGRGA